MTDRNEIEAVVVGMLFAIDAVDWKRIRGSFADEVQVDYTSLSGGSPERLRAEVLMERWQGLLPGFDHTQHLTGPIIVTSLNGDHALAETNVRGYHYLGASPGQTWMVSGHYEMTMSRVGSKWKIAGVRLDVYRIEGDAGLPLAASERAKTHPRIFVRRSP